MTNGEKYKKAFSVLQTSKGSLQEVENLSLIHISEPTRRS